MRYGVLFGIMVVVFGAGCNRDTQGGVAEINVLSMMEKEKNSSIEDLTRDVSIIKIDTGDSIFLSKDATIKLIDDNNIYLESEHQLMRFDKNGKFLNYIGHRGEGPGEYPYVGRVFMNDADNIVLSNSQRLMEFEKDGTQKRVVPITRDFVSLMLTPDMNIRGIHREFDSSGGVEETMVTVDPTGNITDKQILYKDSVPMSIVWNGVPQRYIVNGKEFLRNEWSCSVIEIDDNMKPKPMAHFDFDDKEPSRFNYQDAMGRKKLGVSVVDLSTWITNGRYSFMRIFYKDALYLVAVDHKTGESIFSCRYDKNTVLTGKPGIALKGMESVTVWPDFVDQKGNLYGFVDPGFVSEEDFDKLKELTGKFFSGEDNYFIVKLGMRDEIFNQ